MSTHAAPITQPGLDRPVETLPEMVPERRAAPAEQPAQPGPPPPAPAVPFAPRGRLSRPRDQAQPGLSALLDMVAYAPWSKAEYLSNNTFVPSANALFVFLHFCDTLMLSTDRFTRGHPQWLPYVSRVYIAVLFFFRIMDCMVLSGYADDEIITLLHRIKNTHDFRRLMIPGPLVPFFQALSVCSSGSNLLGDVTPILPNLEYSTSTNFFVATNVDTADLNLNVPNVLALLDSIHKAVLTSKPSDDQMYSPIRHVITSLHSVTATDDNLDSMSLATSGPGFKTSSNLTNSHLWNFSTSVSRLELPTRLDIPNAKRGTSVKLTWSQFLRMDKTPLSSDRTTNLRSWFSNMSQVMSDYSAYFRDSKSLGSIPIAAGAPPHVLIEYQTSTSSTWVYSRPTKVQKDEAADIKDPHLALPLVDTLAATAKIVAPGVPDTHRDLGTLTQINSQGQGQTSPPSVRNGQAWTQSPIQSNMSNFDTFGNVATYVSNLHVSRALE